MCSTRKKSLDFYYPDKQQRFTSTLAIFYSIFKHYDIGWTTFQSFVFLFRKAFKCKLHLSARKCRSPPPSPAKDKQETVTYLYRGSPLSLFWIKPNYHKPVKSFKCVLSQTVVQVSETGESLGDS